MQDIATVPNTGLNLLKKPDLQKKEELKKGFSILDLLVILSAIFVVCFLVYLIINPEKEGADTRNTRRNAGVSSVLASIVSYAKLKGTIPEEIPVGDSCVEYGHEICKMGPFDCKELVNLSFLSSVEGDTNILSSLPEDPDNKSVNGTGYYIVQDGEGRVTVCAPYAERNENISFTQYLY